MASHSFIAAIVLVLCTMLHAQSVEEIRASVDKNEYRAALQKINKALPAARSNNDLRYDLLMLRGEALVQLKQKPAALDAFRTASKTAGNDVDLHKSMAARAMVELLTASEGWTYRPRPGESLAVIDVESRKKAMLALFESRLVATQSKIDSARDARTLRPMIELMPTIAGLMALEFGGTDELATMTPIIESLGTRSRDVITLELNKLDLRISDIEDASGEIIWMDTGGIPARRGIHSDEAKDLAMMSDYLDEIGLAAEEGRRINRRLGGTGEAWDAVLLRISEVKSRSRYVLQTQGQSLLPNR